MHPRDAELFDFGNQDDEAELAAHGISLSEVEQVYLGTHVWAQDKKLATGDWLMVGRTLGGRPLTIVIATDEVFCTIRAITGWDATQGEITRFLSKKIGEPR
jgi:uncharacterized DUF497 family protein